MDVGTDVHDRVREYYGRVLNGSRDLKTDACCCPDDMPEHIKAVLAQINPEITERFYGCGSPIPPALEGCTVLDLGCGTGRDAYVCSKLVGASGSVIGVDMTEAQLDIARRHEVGQATTFGYATPNTSFRHGYMEDLAAVGIEDDSVDVVISNCVVNLSPDKQRVFSEILRVLKPGGELLFSDVFADRRLPAAWQEDKVLVGECLAGAMYIQDFRRMLGELGIPDYRVVSQRRLSLGDQRIGDMVGEVRFYSMTLRAFKLDGLEDRCEDYGQVARYAGTIRQESHAFVLDDHHKFVTGKPALVCGNTAAMLEDTRYAAHFEVDGTRAVHFGLFDCGGAVVTPDGGAADGYSACC